IEDEVLRVVERIGESPEFLDRARKRVVLDRMREGTTTAKSLDGLRNDLEEVKRKQGILYEDRLAGRLDVERWQRFHGELVSREEELVARIDEEERALLSAGSGAHSVGEILDVLRDFRGVFEALEMRERKLVLQSLLQGVRFGRSQTVSVQFLAPWSRLFASESPRAEAGTMLDRRAQ
ncbi:MAG: hypothetical protein ACYTDY_17060, partial [Planctomycetota bacterium]